MWIKKTKKEIEAYHEPIIYKILKRKFLLFILLIPFLVIMQFIIAILYGEGNGYRQSIVRSLSFIDAFHRIPYYFIETSSLVLFIYVLFFLVLRIDRNENKEFKYVCDRCNKTLNKFSDINCECGGEFIHIDKMKWINDR
jgi:predicted membrane protein